MHLGILDELRAISGGLIQEAAARLGPFGGIMLGPSGPNLGQIWINFGSIMGPLSAHVGPILGRIWVPHWAHMCPHWDPVLATTKGLQTSKQTRNRYIYIYIYIYRRFNHMSDGLYICSIRLDLSSARVAMISAGFRHSEHLRKVSPAAATARFGCPGPPHYCPRPL